MNQTFFYFCGIFDTHPPRPAGGQIPLPGVAAAQPPRPAGEAGRIAQASAHRKIFLKNIKKTLDNQENA